MNRTGFILIVLAAFELGCRSPQHVLHTLQNCDPCFAPTVAVCETVPVERVGEAGTIEEFVRVGLERNPRIHEAQHRIDAVRHRIPQVLSLPDPMVNTTTFLAPVQTAAGEQEIALGISQKFTNARRRATQAAIVADEAASAEAELDRVRLEIAESIRVACYQLMFIRKSMEITNEDRESLAQISEVILQQYEVKRSVTQQDVLNVQVEQSEVENQLTVLAQKEKSFQARLARLVHIDPHSKLQILDQFQAGDSQFNVDALIAQAVQCRPDLQSQLANIDRDRKKIHLAQLEDRPDYTVGLNWIGTSTNGVSPVANGDDAVLLGVGFNLPIYKDRIRAGICEARANRRAAESRFSGLRDLAVEEVFDLVARLDSTRDTLELIQGDIIPKSQRTLDLSIEEYATGSIDYEQLITNWRDVLRYRIAEANLQSEYSQLLAALARSVGQLEPIASQPVAMPPEFESGGDARSLNNDPDD